jgi:hypothetical protein
MSNVAYLPGCKPKRRGKRFSEPARKDTAEFLRPLLAAAIRGDLVGFAYVSLKSNGGWGAGIINIGNGNDALEACGMLKGAILGDDTYRVE